MPNKTATQKTDNTRKVGTFGLTMIIVSAMIGGGIFNIPQNMSAVSGTGANIFAWIITAVGMWFVADMFRILSVARPDAKDGIFMYARLGFGRFTGFFSAWGYWVANMFANVAYAVLLFSALNYFFPGVFTGGNNIWSLIGAWVILWAINFIAITGTKNVSAINIVVTIVKILPILLFIVVMCIYFKIPTFIHDFWGLELFPYEPHGAHAAHESETSIAAMSVFKQISNTILITLWMYLGIEGAVVVSDEAKSQNDVSMATGIAFAIVTVLYVMTSVMPNGVFSVKEMSTMGAPSTAELLTMKIGAAGKYIINIAVILSILASWLVWTVMLAEQPKSGAQMYVFPKVFARTNKKGAAYVSLYISTAIMTLFLLIAFFAKDAWTLMLSITGVMYIPCYITCIMYLFKVAFDKNETYPDKIFATRRHAQATAVIAGIYGLYLIYAAGYKYLFAASFVYAIGIPVYAGARLQDPNNKDKQIYSNKQELAFMIILGLIGLAGIIYTGIFYKEFLAG